VIGTSIGIAVAPADGADPDQLLKNADVALYLAKADGRGRYRFLCRRKTRYLELRRHLGDVFRKLAEQKESRIEEGHLLLDHVHMLISIPPKYAVSQVIGFIKGKSAIHLARVYGEKKRNFVGQHFWARGYFVSTVGRRRAKAESLLIEIDSFAPRPKSSSAARSLIL
jgi:REP element-mobilizing transposase RayT